MKKWILGFSMVAVLGFSSCESPQLEPQAEESALVDLFALATVSDSTGRPMKKLTQVAIDDLPAAITNYVQTTYPRASIQGAARGENGFTLVRIKLGNGNPLVLVFDMNQTFVKALNPRSHHGTPVAIEALPEVIRTYIQTNFAGSKILHARTGPEGRFGILIRKADNTVAVLGFAADGTFLAEAKPGEHGRRKRK